MCIYIYIFAVKPQLLITNALVLTNAIKRKTPCYESREILGCLMKWAIPPMHTLKNDMKAVLLREDTITEQLTKIFESVRTTPEWKEFTRMAGIDRPSFSGSPAICAAVYLMSTGNLSSSLLTTPNFSEVLRMSGSEEEGCVFQHVRDRFACAILEFK